MKKYTSVSGLINQESLSKLDELREMFLGCNFRITLLEDRVHVRVETDTLCLNFSNTKGLSGDWSEPTLIECLQKIQLEANEYFKNKLKNAVTVLLFNDVGEILAVSRKHDQTKFGLPGGKVCDQDGAETLEEAAIRECFEETGLVITNLNKIFEHMADEKYWTTCFSADYDGKINTKEDGAVKWIDKETLFAGPFGNYNKKLFAAIGK